MSELGKRSDKVAGKQRYELARMKQAHLASCLLLWHNGRLSDIKDAVLNWDVRKLRTGGGIVWVMDPVEFKTKWRTLEADLREDRGVVNAFLFFFLSKLQLTRSKCNHIAFSRGSGQVSPREAWQSLDGVLEAAPPCPHEVAWPTGQAQRHLHR